MRPLARLAQPQPQFYIGSGFPGTEGDPTAGYKPDPFHPGGGTRPPGPGFNPDDVDENGLMKPDPYRGPVYMHSLATPALRQAGYGPGQANRLIRLARRGQLGQYQDPVSGAYHDPTIGRMNPAYWYDPTPPVPGTYVPPVTTAAGTRPGYTPSVDPDEGDTRARRPGDPGYYGGFTAAGVRPTPAAQQGLEAVQARWAARRARRQG